MVYYYILRLNWRRNWKNSYIPIPNDLFNCYDTFHVLEFLTIVLQQKSLQGRHNEGDGVSNDRRLDYLLNRFFRRRS